VLEEMTTTATYARCPGARSDDLARVALRALGRLAFAALAVFHAWVLAAHLLQGKAFEPDTAIRWVVAAVVLIGFRALSRRGLPLFSGRHAVVLWLLVVLIHCSAAWSGGAASLEAGLPETVTALAQLSTVAGVLVGVVLGIALASARRPWDARRLAFPAPVLIGGLPSTGVVFRFSPRPPPLA
jgi:hypothetical protein